MCVAPSVCLLNVHCDREEKAHLSQHAVEPSRGQRAVQVCTNEERRSANHGAAAGEEAPLAGQSDAGG